MGSMWGSRVESTANDVRMYNSVLAFFGWALLGILDRKAVMLL